MSEELIPLAWLVKHEMHGTEVTQQQCTEADRQYGWTETPLYTFEQLQGFNRLVARVSTSNPVVDHETGNTSDKLRDALEVWRDASEAYSYPVTDEYGYLFAPEERADRAAAIIEADRQATRAALVAEIVAEAHGETGSAWSRDAVQFADYIEAKWGTPTHS